MTETDVEQGLDIESIESIDFEYEIPCDVNLYGDKECLEPVEWYFIVTCCGHKFFMCQKHFDWLIEIAARKAPSFCNNCGFTSTADKLIMETGRLDRR